MKIKLFNKIDNIGLEIIKDNYEISENIENEDAIIVRSANLLDLEFNKELKCISRAGAGVNNIPIDRCSENGIVVFNTPGANANAVKELTLCALFLLSRDIIGGNNWVKTLNGEDFAVQVEKGKSNFSGNEVYGKKLGVIGLGAIGANVANTAIHLGMDVLGYDPYISVNGAWSLNRSIKHMTNLNELLAQSDYLTIHIPSVKETKQFINKETINMMKDGIKILNFARGDLINEDDLLEALDNGKIAKYITDFGSSNLNKNNKVITLPHLGASTYESEENCAVMAVKEMKDYLEYGNIKNSVNFPSIVEPMTTSHRVTIIHKNVPNMLAQFATIVASNNINIENMFNKAKDNYAYTIIDTNDNVDTKAFENIENVIRVRVIQNI